VLFGFYHNSGNDNNRTETNRKKKEGEVFINHNPAKKKKMIQKDEGEYVKFKESKEED
jgi:hypothetical protein